MILSYFGVLISGVVSVFTVNLIIRHAGRLGLVQHANQRSSHTHPTPTGGGIGIVLGTIAGGGVICFSDVLLMELLGLILVMALLGLVDDRWPLPAKLRLVVQFGILSVFVIISGPLVLAMSTWPGEIWPIPVSVLLIIIGVWWTNLFNFMDGIDGFAASQALCMLTGALILAWLSDSVSLKQPLIWLMLSVSVATCGFLIHNWPKAKIFMGDVGSLVLGFLLFAFAILSAAVGWMSLWQWAILGAVFAVDATVTLLRRLVRGERAMQAHRCHAYQQLASRWSSHQTVTLALVSLNLLVLLPFAWAAGFWPDLAWAITTSTYVVFALAAFSFGAGKED